ncbi:LOW QUALITY PROTEIN: ribosomal RNA small subunit methyltransferase C [Limimaricola cinnabarinus LL-001]|uniref:Ribosomal RNA small subunit methyltransferase C n=1 Tax=Limimaricola cinnabarinus LL-001 TaxID=1337093 RepID=U2YLF6_9RHOB|nr:LOW QUALITY PROTEIN: ribosomal RNA small subunit methyltransferase C [Limimaricola cinnabarinus LL-001]
MADARLTTAIESGALVLPEGEILALRPAAGTDLSALPRDRTRILHGFRPDIDAWEAQGWTVSEAEAEAETDPAGAAVVFVPRSKPLARACLAQAAALAPLVIVDGQKTDGVDSLWREMRTRTGDLPCVTRAHGRLFWFESTAVDISDWTAPAPAPVDGGFVTQWGAFSADGPDRGSQMLAAALPGKLPSRMADLGAGWGYLARAVLERDGVKSIDLVEAEKLALDCARRNVTDPRAAFHWADVTRFKPDHLYDGIVSNPPFHVGRAADPALGRAFIVAAARMLAPSGQLWMVANRHLPYESSLRESFRSVEEIGGDGTFKLFHAIRPLKPTDKKPR